MKTFIFILFSLFVIVLTSNAQLLYGTTSEGGQFGKGTICTYNPATQSLNAVKSFYSTDGNFPYGSLILAGNGKLYGATMRGGANGFGSIFSYDAATGTYTQLANFDGANGANPQGNLLQAKDGKLYGTANAIFSFDPATSTITRLHDLNSSN